VPAAAEGSVQTARGVADMSLDRNALTKVLIANRGEIAARIARTCAELGIASVAVFSDADEGALHARLADTAVRLKGNGPAETYLNAEEIVRISRETGVDAVHPGYGFLSESSSFAALVAASGMTFIGPPSAAIEAMGDKTSARAIAEASGVPVVPAITGTDLSAAELREFGRENGWPVVVKAAHGGGGRGIRVVTAPADAGASLDSAKAESLAAFGDGTVYAERYLSGARHIEIQIFADTHGNAIWLGDRDCSVQRRHQKLVEESPADIDPALRSRMGESAVRLALHVGYVGAGTVEFLVEDDAYYFLEMNTRIQVEHPVTEAVHGIDLIREQLLVAGGAPLSVADSLTARGHAIECRINAEDPFREFVPTPAQIQSIEIPWGPGIRFDSGYEAGDAIPPFYDSLLGKLIAWGPTREIALHRLTGALAASRVAGPATTLPAALAIAQHPDFIRGRVSTDWFGQTMASTLTDGSDLAEPGQAAAPATPSSAPRPEERPAFVGGRQYRVPGRGAARRAVPAGARAAGAPGVRTRSPLPATASPAELRSPMQGSVTSVRVKPGDQISSGQVLATLEAMKMEYPVRAPSEGRIEVVAVSVGDVITAGSMLFRLAASS